MPQISIPLVNILSPKRTGGIPSATPLIPTMHHEWYFNNVQNASADIITIPDTGTVGGLDISNPALANKPTQSSIGGKISYAADGVDDYLYKAETDFMKSMPTWMVYIVWKYDSSGINRFLSSHNETNTNQEGWQMRYRNDTSNFEMYSFNSSGSTVPIVLANQALTNGNNYVTVFAYNGTNAQIYNETIQIGTRTISSPMGFPTQTDNITTTCLIKPINGNVFGLGNIGYIGVDEFDLTRLNANVATLKSTFGI